MNAKYPRTAHLPWSPGATNDDRKHDSVTQFLGRRLVMTEKLDGSNVCLTNTDVFARSHVGAPRHPSFDALKAVHANIKHLIPPNLSIFGEWCYAVHSIEYTGLNRYLNLFAVRDDETKVWLDYGVVCDWAIELDVTTVPLLSACSWDTEKELQAWSTRYVDMPSVYGPTREGIVIRPYGPVADEVITRFVAKWVRADHVQTDEHWSLQKIKRQPIAM